MVPNRCARFAAPRAGRCGGLGTSHRSSSDLRPSVAPVFWKGTWESCIGSSFCIDTKFKQMSKHCRPAHKSTLNPFLNCLHFFCSVSHSKPRGQDDDSLLEPNPSLINTHTHTHNQRPFDIECFRITAMTSLQSNVGVGLKCERTSDSWTS